MTNAAELSGLHLETCPVAQAIPESALNLRVTRQAGCV
jgi:hypothetical protein